MVSEPTRRDRFRGSMMGVAVGDCLGRPMEGRLHVPAEYVEGLVDSPPPLVYTDDTAMTIGLAASLLASGGFSGQDMARRFAREFRRQPDRGYGAGVVDVFDRVLGGVPWQQAAARQFGGEGSFGNGAAMRVAPVALWADPDLEETAQLAADTARVTHTHPVGVEGAVVAAVTVGHALASPASEPFATDALLADLGARVETEEFRTGLEMLPACLAAGDDQRAVLQLGNSVTAHRSVLTAVYCFLSAPDLPGAIRRAVGVGGDADTIAAMAGAMAGARFGMEALPARWQRVEGAETLVELADALHDRP